MAIVELVHLGLELKDPEVGEREHFPALEKKLEELPTGSDVIFDFRGVEFIGYAYSKQTIRPWFERLVDGTLNHRALILACDRDDFLVHLEAVHLALAELRLTSLLWLTLPNRLTMLGYLVYEPPFESKKERSKKEKMRKILELILDNSELYTNEIAKNLALTLQNCNFLLGELERMHLVERVKETSPSGGPLFLNRLIFSN